MLRAIFELFMRLGCSVHLLSVPMKRTFAHARATRQLAESVVVRVDLDGALGHGEGVPREYVTDETPVSAFEAICHLDLAKLIRELDLADFGAAVQSVERLQLPERLRQGPAVGLAASCALEVALLDALGRRFGQSLAELPAILGVSPALHSRGSEVHPTVRAADATTPPSQLFLRYEREPFSVLKLKTGLGREIDCDRASAARAAAPPQFALTVDANMAWSPLEALEMIELLRPFQIAWYEEPLARGSLAEYAELRQRSNVRIMLDESLTSWESAERAVTARACDLFNIRLSKNGGLISSIRLIELAHRHGLGYQLGTHPGQHAILRAAEWQLATTLSGFIAVEAAVTGTWFDEELASERLAIGPGPRLIPLEGAGLGIEVISERLFRATRRRADWSATRGIWTENGSDTSS